ncbi:MAG: UDP-N-acetylglucosamine diphosphorylase [Verrucomicrobia bacterium]|nr:UDP-N-acetylglucosamine diphosphorylase [Verrucomicrobiota bacterium]
MNQFPATLFFNLQRYAHRELWIEGEPVWSALHVLKKYFTSWKHRIEIEIPPGVHLEKPELITIGQGTVLEPGVFIQGPCILGKGCVVRHGAYLREFVLCGDHCAIGHSAELKHSILLDSANATHFVYVGDSILGNGVNLGAGVKCANLRLDRKEISVSIEGTRMKTGLKKMGAIVGDHCQVGCNAVLNPGTMMGQDSVCPGLVSLSGFIPPRSQIKQGRSWTVEPIEESILEQIGKS